MTTRWYVHKDSQAQGPFTATELRQNLREGRVDPFDHVSREGSNVRLELVEVDDIFTEQHPNLVATAAPAVGDIPEVVAAAAAIPAANLAPAPIAPVPPRPGRQTPRAGERTSRSDAKKYFLQDRKKRLLGPLSAREIESLYSRGRLDGAVRVFKNGGSKGITIGSFLAAYVGAKYAELSEANGLSTADAVTRPAEGLPNSRVMEELTRVVALRGMSANSTPWITVAGLVVGIAAAYFVARQYILPRLGPSAPISWTLPGDKPADQPIEVPASAPAVMELDPVAVIAQPTAKTQAPQVPKATKPAATNNSAERRPQPKPPARRAATPPAPYRAPVANKQRAATPAKVVAPRKTAPPPSTGASIAELSGKVGTLATIGPLSFNPAELNACGMKCTLIFRDQFGGSLPVVFFKGKFADALTRKRGRATIRGNLSDSSGKLTMFLQSVL